MDANKRLISELVVITNVNNILENRLVNLEKQISKAEQHKCRKKFEMPGISNEIPDQD